MQARGGQEGRQEMGRRAGRRAGRRWAGGQAKGGQAGRGQEGRQEVGRQGIGKWGRTTVCKGVPLISNSPSFYSCQTFWESHGWCPEDFTTKGNGKVRIKMVRTFILWETRNH